MREEPGRFGARILAALALSTAGCQHLFHHVGPLPGGRERVVTEFAHLDWRVQLRVNLRGEHVVDHSAFVETPRDVWTAAHTVMVARGPGMALSPAWEIWRATFGSSENPSLGRSEAEDAFEHSVLESCASPDGQRMMLRVHRTVPNRIPAAADRVWWSVYALRDALAIDSTDIQAPDCASALAALPTAEAWLRRALARDGHTPVNLTRGREPISAPGALPGWASAWPFVFAVREGVAFESALDYALATPDVYRMRERVADELGTFEQALGNGADDPAGNALEARLERDLTPGVAFDVDGNTPVGSEHDPAVISMARVLFAHTAPAFRAAAADRLVNHWAGVGTVDFGELWRYRALAALVADQADAARCDRLLAALPARVTPESYSHEEFAAAALRWLPSCATPAATLRAARALLAPLPSAALDPARVFTVVGFQECNVDAPADTARLCDSSPLRAAQLLAGHCDAETLTAARQALAGPFRTPRMAGERVMASCHAPARATQ